MLDEFEQEVGLQYLKALHLNDSKGTARTLCNYHMHRLDGLDSTFSLFCREARLQPRSPRRHRERSHRNLCFPGHRQRAQTGQHPSHTGDTWTVRRLQREGVDQCVPVKRLDTISH